MAKKQPAEEEQSRLIQQILDSLTGLKYGSVQIVVHDGKVVQVERLEKFRLDQTDSKK